MTRARTTGSDTAVARCRRDRRAAHHRHRRGLRRRGDGRRQVGAGTRPRVVRRSASTHATQRSRGFPRARRAAVRASTSSAPKCSRSPPHLGDVSSPARAAGKHHLIAPEAPTRGLIVDGNNVIGSRPDGWWRDRAGAARRLIASLQDLATRTRRSDLRSCSTAGRFADVPEGVHDGRAGRVRDARRPGRGRRSHRAERSSETASPRRSWSSRPIAALAERARALGARGRGRGCAPRSARPT